MERVLNRILRKLMNKGMNSGVRAISNRMNRAEPDGQDNSRRPPQPHHNPKIWRKALRVFRRIAKF